MAHSKSALKRWRQNEAHRARNRVVRSETRTAVRKARAAVGGGVADEAQAAITAATSILDKAAKRHVIHRNTAARHKSRLMRQLNKSGASGATAAAPKRARRTATRTKAAAKPRATSTRRTASSRTKKSE